MRIPTILAVASALLTTATADFHILLGHCVEREFSKRSEPIPLPPPHLPSSPHPTPNKPHQINATLTPRRANGGGSPPAWHDSARYSLLNLMPSNQFGCNWLQNHDVTSYSSLPDDFFRVRDLCGKPLDFFKKGDKWEVWHTNVNPGVKYGECYPDPAEMTCELNGVFIRERCVWSRMYVCPMAVC
ncbi:hypothetical protein QBC34DRAFT_411233 [Podospora aff. communis PSN243]|uniref:Uncharacterized protein n=1 Tax=Podospora aff. communis PSN243 TaxID=3040156 RepID=A0AAV9GF37_9PEZI|nr:hypothetical protein QBC34DRAFT_411233 [Podospora aff. communis PSN243]